MLHEPANTDIVLTSEAARILDRTPACVRDMERRGVLHANRTPSGVRLFSRTQIERIARERADVVEQRKR